MVPFADAWMADNLTPEDEETQPAFAHSEHWHLYLKGEATFEELSAHNKRVAAWSKLAHDKRGPKPALETKQTKAEGDYMRKAFLAFNRPDRRIKFSSVHADTPGPVTSD